MGSQTFEILRQGFWASFTGGWFYDPHQDIFCNTFHLYLWMTLLLIPFVLYLTAESMLLTLILYPSFIFCFFSVVKLLNHKLHILFDGEELLESKHGKHEGGKEHIELNVFNTNQSASSSPKINAESLETIEEAYKRVDFEDAINHVLSKMDNEEYLQGLSTPTLPDNSPTIAVQGNKVSQDNLNTWVVDVHAQPADENTEPRDQAGMPSVLDVDETKKTIQKMKTDEIVNNPTVITDNDVNVPCASNDQCLQVLLDTEEGRSYSTWGSSSSSSSLCDDMKLSTLFPPDDCTEGGTSYGENKHSSLRVASEVDVSDQVVSIPVLERDVDNEENGSGTSKETHSKTVPDVWFSLPEIEDANNGIQSNLDDSISVKLNDLLSQCHASDNNVGAETPTFSHSDNAYAVNFKTSQKRQIRRVGACRGTRQRRVSTSSGSPGSSLLCHETEGSTEESKHIAMTHEDTTTGAVHCFKDEFGQWFSYTFGEDNGTALPQPFFAEGVPEIPSVESIPIKASSRDSAGSSPYPVRENFDDIRLFGNRSILENFNWHHRTAGLSNAKKENEEEANQKYYLLPLIGSYSMKVSFDRLALLAVLDRNKNVMHSILSICLATLVALLGCILLWREYFLDLWLFVACFILAKCQFSLLKSVQPDSSSPVHGHNTTVAYSRAIYFCIVAVLIIIIDVMSTTPGNSITLYTVPLYSKHTLEFARDLLIGFLLAFPLIFVFGLLPQINTFTMHVLEQAEIHVFGGSALTSLQASLFSFSRSVVATVLLTALCYIPMKFASDGKPRGQNVFFSIYSGLLVAVSYHLSRSTSTPEILLKVIKKMCCCEDEEEKSSDDIDDPLPEKLMKTVNIRVVHDIVACIMIAFFVFAVHLSTVFTSLQPTLSYVVYIVTGVVGVLLHYLLPQLRKQLPWFFISSPVLKSYEYYLYECQENSRIMWFEKMYAWLSIIEKNFLYPVLCLSAMTNDADQIANKFTPIVASMIVTVASSKLLRSSFSNPIHQHIILIWTVLFFNYDYKGYSETFLIDYFFMAVVVEKTYELYMKFKFVLTYTAPWQISWGSAFHAFAQPFSVPHCGMLFIQTIVSTFFSAPLNPLLGSAIFVTSYMRPVKFWEKDYNTKRVDHSNTRLSSHIDSNPGADDNNLNSIFYEHLTRSLQKSLCGDLLLGRWGKFASGDCFIIASYNLNALVHIIEVGNGFVTFQLRGLEFRGTYCQQREVEAITEDVDYDKGFCCFQPGHIHGLLSLNSAFTQRWLSWEVAQSKYIVEGYSVSDNTATTMFQLFDLRKIFISYYVTSIIFYCVRNKKLSTWLNDGAMMDQLKELESSQFVDLDTVFRPVTDKDYDTVNDGMTRASFVASFHDWIVCCNSKRGEEKIKDDSASSRLTTLCFALSLLGRRLLSTASNNQCNTFLKTFLHGLLSLIKGDFRVTAAKDEWVFIEPDMALLKTVISPAVRMALKLHQDHFTCIDDYDDNDVLHETIQSYEETFVICHEGHPEWRQAVLHNRSNLLALRYVLDDVSDDYKIIMLVKRCLNFRVIKVNKECVRGLWAGQLQELIFLRNRNPERGSIQNAKQALRNMINSSCDQPIGYPIYVSPLTTSYAETNPFYSGISVGNLNGASIRDFFHRFYRGIVDQFVGHCRDPGSREVEIELTFHENVAKASTSRANKALAMKPEHTRANSYTSIPLSSNGSSSSGSTSCVVKSTYFPYFPIEGKARLRDITHVTQALNSRLTTELAWPNLQWLRERANMNHWDGWYPHENMIGDILYHWDPISTDPNRKCCIDKKIYILKVDDYVVPVTEGGIVLLDPDLNEITV